MKAIFTEFTKGQNWVSGKIEGTKYIFSSKLFDVGSGYGINDGRVSKLSIYEDGKSFFDSVIVNYDRSWDVIPETEEERDIYHEVLSLLENAPKLFE